METRTTETGNKYDLGIAFIIASVIIGSLTIIFGQVGMGNTAAVLTMILATITVFMVMAGGLLVFTNILDEYAIPVANEIARDLSDDFEDIKQGRFTKTMIMAILTVLIGLAFTYLVFRYDKFAAKWGIFPIWMLALVVVALGTYLVSLTDWFNNQRYRTPFWVFLIPLAGIAVSTGLGIVNTEDVRHIDPTSEIYTETGYNYYYSPRYLNFSSGGDLDSGGGFDADDFDCDGEGCAYILLLVLLIIVTVVLIIGSAFIPHFWLLSGILFLTIMIIITIHELRVRPYRRSYSY